MIRASFFALMILASCARARVVAAIGFIITVAAICAAYTLYLT